jgi:hypothetical protein
MLLRGGLGLASGPSPITPTGKGGNKGGSGGLRAPLPLLVVMVVSPHGFEAAWKVVCGGSLGSVPLLALAAVVVVVVSAGAGRVDGTVAGGSCTCT